MVNELLTTSPAPTEVHGQTTITAQFIQRSIYKSLRELPALPDAVLNVVTETNRPDPSASRIEKFVASDQALASKILRVVNSAYYGLSGQVSNLGQAVMILGMQQVRNLVLSMGALSMFDSRMPEKTQMFNRFWHHSFSTAAGAQIVARIKRLDRSSVESVFLAGLLHDVGKLFLYANFTNAYEQLINKAALNQMPMHEAEAHLLGIDHAEVGEFMAEFWKLPDVLSNAIGKHEGPFDGTEDPTVYCVHIADCMAKEIYAGKSDGGEVVLDPVAAAWLGLSEAEFTEMRQEVNLKTQEALDLFKQMAA